MPPQIFFLFILSRFTFCYTITMVALRIGESNGTPIRSLRETNWGHDL
jgi:hypothetical protein